MEDNKDLFQELKSGVRYAAETMYTKGELKVIRERQSFEQLLQNDRIIEL